MTLESLSLIESYTVHPNITHGNCSVLSSSWVTYVERSDASKLVGGDWKIKIEEREAFLTSGPISPKIKFPTFHGARSGYDMGLVILSYA